MIYFRERQKVSPQQGLFEITSKITGRPLFDRGGLFFFDMLVADILTKVTKMLSLRYQLVKLLHFPIGSMSLAIIYTLPKNE